MAKGKSKGKGKAAARPAPVLVVEPAAWPANRTERRAIGELLPYANNARTHSAVQVEQIAGAIAKWGWTVPVLVDEGGMILAGHGRVLAAKRLGLTEVPVMVAQGWSDAAKRAYVLADNKIPENAGWDKELLGLELLELKGMADVDLGLVGFSEAEQRRLIAEPEREGLTDPDAETAVSAQVVSQLGDVWLLGEHRLICGDATNAEHVAAVLGGDQPRLVLTDPPYGVNFERGKFVSEDRAARGPGFVPIANDKLTGEPLTALVAEAMRLCAPIETGVAAYVFSASLAPGFDIYAGIVRAGFRVQSQLIWRKTPFVLGQADYHWQHEICWYGFKGAGHYWCGARDKGSVIDCLKPLKMDLHPTMKPVALFQALIENSSRESEIVVDPFSGSGTTIIAAEMTGRRARAIELEPAYVDVAVRRWEAFTGKRAILAAGDLSMADAAVQRRPLQAA